MTSTLSLVPIPPPPPPPLQHCKRVWERHQYTETETDSCQPSERMPANLSNHQMFFLLEEHEQLGTRLRSPTITQPAMNSFFVPLYPDRGTVSAPVSLTTSSQQVPQPGPNSMPGRYWSGGGIPSGPSHGSMYPPPPPLSTGACTSQQSLPPEHPPPPPPMSQQLHPRPLQRRARGLYMVMLL